LSRESPGGSGFYAKSGPILGLFGVRSSKAPDQEPGLSVWDAEAKLPIQPKFFFDFLRKRLGVGFAVDRAVWAVMTPVTFIANFFHGATSKGERKEKGTPLLTRLQFDR
jgi:hypothetical protein